MTKVNVTRKVKCSADEAYAIISDVPRYKDFLPFVKESRILASAQATPAVKEATAWLRVRYKKIALDEGFTSKVAFDKANRTISMTSADGPIRQLAATWTVAPTGKDTCELTLDTDFSLKSKTLQFVLSGMIDYLVRRLMTAFEERAMAAHAAVSA